MRRALAIAVALALISVAIPDTARDECATDSECAELCPEGTRDLPADHPDYCDGGPQDARPQK